MCDKLKNLDEKVKNLERQLKEARAAADKVRDEATAHYGVWSRLCDEARDCHNNALCAYARKIEVTKMVKAGKKAGKTYQIYKKPGDDDDRGSDIITRAFGPAMMTTIVEHEAWKAYKEADETYKNTCAKANAYRKKYGVWDSKDIKPVEFLF
jgi:hypothetical protein